MTFHYMKITTYCHATEEPVRVKQALVNLVGEDMEIMENEVLGHYGNTIVVMELEINKNSQINNIFKMLSQEELKSLWEEADRRVDDDCNFYFRLDKGSAYEEKPILSNGNYIIKIRCKIESYPAKRSSAVNNIRDHLQNLIKD